MTKDNGPPSDGKEEEVKEEEKESEKEELGGRGD